MQREGVLLMNIGTPDEPTVESVREYLREFLLDPDVIDIPAPLRHLLVRGIILRTRPKKIAPSYQSIWMKEGSPLRVYTQRMTEALEKILNDTPCEVGMRYGNPSIRLGLERLREKGVERLLLAPLFPQYAQATTVSSLKCANDELKKMNWAPEIIELGHFESDDAYIDPLVSSIQTHLEDSSHLLFSYHGLPLSHIRRADPTGKHCQKVDHCCSLIENANSSCYAHHCMMTTLAVTKKLGLKKSNWSISYQSKIGPVKWLRPSTIEMVEQLAKKEINKLIIVSPAFLADGLETLEELDIEIREHYVKHGGGKLEIISCLNDNSDWIEGLSTLVTRKFSTLPMMES
tara:strand:+ start:979 stop:2016 length:1038 start_codon:yes stop_codon:yes gene_type:complete